MTCVYYAKRVVWCKGLERGCEDAGSSLVDTYICVPKVKKRVPGRSNGLVHIVTSYRQSCPVHFSSHLVSRFASSHSRLSPFFSFSLFSSSAHAVPSFSSFSLQGNKKWCNNTGIRLEAVLWIQPKTLSHELINGAGREQGPGFLPPRTSIFFTAN